MHRSILEHAHPVVEIAVVVRQALPQPLGANPVEPTAWQQQFRSIYAVVDILARSTFTLRPLARSSSSRVLPVPSSRAPASCGNRSVL